jgi:O-antigen/teichoic acid export membrane protein
VGRTAPEPSRSAGPEPLCPTGARRPLRRALRHPLAQNAMAVLNGLSPVWFFAGIERLRLVATVDVAIRALTAAAIILAVRHHGEGLRVLSIWTFGAGTSLVVLTTLMYRRIPYHRPTSGQRRLALREGRSLFVAGAAVSLYTSATVFMLGLVVSSAQRLSALVLAAVCGLGTLAALSLLWLAPWLVHVLLGDQFAGSPVVGVLAGPVGVAWTLVAIETCAALALVWVARSRGLMPTRAEALGR